MCKKEEYSNTISFRVWGNKALFTDPATRIGGEKCTYPIPTYEAIKGICKAIYWKPTLTWYIDKIRVMNPIKMSPDMVRGMSYTSKTDSLFTYTYLTDVEYQVQAHFDWNFNQCRDNLEQDRNREKHCAIAQRSLRHGGRHDIFLGTRECQGYVEPCEFGKGHGEYDEKDIDFGFMYHGLTYADEAYDETTENKITANFWDVKMEHGIITFPSPEACIYHKQIRNMKPKKFGKEYNNLRPVEEEEKIE